MVERRKWISPVSRVGWEANVNREQRRAPGTQWANKCTVCLSECMESTSKEEKKKRNIEIYRVVEVEKGKVK